MTHIIKKTLFVLLLALSAFGCADPYYYHGYGRGGYAPYTTPYDSGPLWHSWGGGYHHHHDYDHDGD